MPNSSVSIIGTGNMADNLLQAFKNSNIKISGLFGRDKEAVSKLINQYKLKEIPELENVDPDSVVFLCVSDDAVSELSQQLGPNIKIVHTSGSVLMSALTNHERIGVFYPLQTLTKGREISFNDVPILIEANSSEFEKEIRGIAEKISSKVTIYSSEERKKIHLAAVILNNFITQLSKTAFDYLKNNEINSDLLKPLLFETINKINEQGAEEALTGPAKRGDKMTVMSHLEMLNENKDLKSIYELMSNIILKENGKL